MSQLPQHYSLFAGDGEIRSLLRTHDWSGFPAGPPERWPAAIQATIRMILDSGSPISFFWGADLRYFYNDAYAEVIGAKHPSALARPFWESWTEVVDAFSPIMNGALSGSCCSLENMEFAVIRHGKMEKAWFTFSLLPVLSDGGEVIGILNPCIETTVQVLNDRRLEFQLELADRIRSLAAPDDITAVASELLGQQLGVARVGYVEVDDAGETVSIKRDWTNGELASMAGKVLRFDDFGPLISGTLRAGQILAVRDIEADQRSRPYAHAYEANGVRSFLAIPLMKAGRLRAVLQIHQPRIHCWTDHDIALAEDMVEQTWAAAECAYAEDKRRRAEDELRRSVERQSFQLKIADLLRSLSNADEIFSKTSELLGRYLKVCRVLYGEYDIERGLITFHSNYTDGTVGAINGRYPAASFGAHNFASLEGGATWTCDDLAQDPRTAGPDTWPTFAAFGIHSGVVVPLSRQGTLIACLFVNEKKPRRWSSDEVRLIEDVAERVWGEVERARSEQERKRAEEKLRETDRHKDEFLAMLAHELRNPLAPIGAAAELLKLAKLDEARVRQTSEIIGRQVRHMTSLVDDLLDVSRVTRGLVKLEQAPLDMRHIVTDAVEQVNPLIQSRRHHLVLHLSPDAAMVTGDKKRLVQVIANLLNNAAKYTPEGGELLLRTEVRDDRVLLSVQDNGIGMEPELVARVFDLFAQAERSADRSLGGLGLGLALVKSLVGLHGGTVSCVSEGAGRGSKFTVALPRCDDQSRAAERRQRERHIRPSAKPLRLLVVDDNMDAARMLAIFLDASGHQALVEHDSRRALELARIERPDVCVLDIGLPGMDGNELAQRLRAQPETAKSVLIAVSGYGQERDRETALAAGFDHYLVKPVNTSKLVALLAEIGAS